MLEPPITNIGIKGIRKAAERVLNWPETMDTPMRCGGPASTVSSSSTLLAAAGAGYSVTCMGVI